MSSAVWWPPTDSRKLPTACPTGPSYITRGPCSAICRRVLARAGLRTTSPGAGNRPPGANVFSAGSLSVRSPFRIAFTRWRLAGNPSAAKPIADWSSEPRSRVPNRSRAMFQPWTQPGVTTLSGPRSGTRSWPAVRTNSAVAFEPARPLAFSTIGCSAPGRLIRRKRSPPTPHIWGQTTPSTAQAATHASSALPPSCSTRNPAAEAR